MIKTTKFDAFLLGVVVGFFACMALLVLIGRL